MFEKRLTQFVLTVCNTNYLQNLESEVECGVWQGTGQGRILAPFTYKVYINALLKELSSHAYRVSINTLSLTSRSFSNDISLIAIQPSFLTASCRCVTAAV